LRIGKRRESSADDKTIAGANMKIRLSLLMFTLLLGSGCVVQTQPPAPVKAAVGQPVALKIGQSAEFDDGTVLTFQNVPTDGRCSSCTASYYAEVALSLTPAGKSPVTIAVRTPPQSQVIGDPSPYRIELVKLEPQRTYPPDPIDKSDYVATVKMSK
jgi:hypothetical protein